ncbi:UDP-glycosyltransferase UGT5 isoform X1 [Diabrotica virgifera virgifera]|uniref:UDP-glucuronosyltransferase n=1 Tax=Diabrotica virgifera virgifera TaxID=50390 RepID=A0ABM5IIU2_DIAVI|nr:UDP-glycosyltransferase UGT5 isoform X1 [Diabrotica virgifera virgifera]
MARIISILVLFLIHSATSAKILSVIPSASRSHHLPFQPLWRELALRGHEVTVVTTDPQRNASIENLKEIDTSFCYKIYEKHNVVNAIANESLSSLEKAGVLRRAFLECEDYHFSLPPIREMIINKKIHFDLLIVEAQLPSMLAFSWRFKCPVIAVASMEPALQYHDSLGNPVHPVINPDYNLDVIDSENLTFKERLLSFLQVVIYKYHIYNRAFPAYHEHVKKYFGKDLPPLKELQDSISLMFIGSHPLFHNIRPLNLNTIPIGGGMHIKAPKKLPNDLQKFLDDSKTGVIYFSLGSNVNSNLLTTEFKKAVVEAFAEVPHNVLLKMDGEIEGLSKNVMVRKWMPQQDILRHPNIKLFITQGGLQSLQESVVNGIPLIGIPFFGDQITNVNKMVKKGYGVKVDRRSMTKEILVAAIRQVMTNPSYKETAEAMGEIFKDEEIPSLQRAVYWTEYVIRHKGAKHLRSPGIGMPAWKYYMLDVMGFLAFVCLTIIIGIFLILRGFFRWLKYLVKGDAKKTRKTKKKD